MTALVCWCVHPFIPFRPSCRVPFRCATIFLCADFRGFHFKFAIFFSVWCWRCFEFDFECECGVFFVVYRCGTYVSWRDRELRARGCWVGSFLASCFLSLEHLANPPNNTEGNMPGGMVALGTCFFNTTIACLPCRLFLSLFTIETKEVIQYIICFFSCCAALTAYARACVRAVRCWRARPATLFCIYSWRGRRRAGLFNFFLLGGGAG